MRNIVFCGNSKVFDGVLTEGDKGQMTMEAFRDLIAGLVKEEIDANKLEKK